MSEIIEEKQKRLRLSITEKKEAVDFLANNTVSQRPAARVLSAKFGRAISRTVDIYNEKKRAEIKSWHIVLAYW